MSIEQKHELTQAGSRAEGENGIEKREQPIGFVLFDIDGSLIFRDPQYGISGPAEKIPTRLINTLSEKEIPVGFCTGRNIMGTIWLREQLRGCHQGPSIYDNGATVAMPDGGIIHQETFSEEEKTTAIEVLRANMEKINAVLFYPNGKQTTCFCPEDREFKKHAHYVEKRVKNVEEWFQEFWSEEVPQIIINTKEPLDGLESINKSTNMSETWTNFHSREVSKASGIFKFMEAYGNPNGIEFENVLYVNDGDGNDQSTLTDKLKGMLKLLIGKSLPGIEEKRKDVDRAPSHISISRYLRKKYNLDKN